MYKKLVILIMLALVLAACGKKEQEERETQLRMQADQARLDLQKKADELARNPPPELIQAAREQAAKEAAKGQ